MPPFTPSETRRRHPFAKSAAGPWREAACLTHRLKAGHECTADAARVLRLPGTTNRKIPGKPRLVTLDPRFLGIEPYDLARFDTLVDYAPGGSRARTLICEAVKYSTAADACRRLIDIIRGVPRSLRASRCRGACGRLRGCRGISTHRGHFRARLDAARPPHALRPGRRAPLSEYSKNNYRRYDRQETQRKYDRAANLTGPPKCLGF